MNSPTPTETPLPTLIASMKEAAEKATPGPWKYAKRMIEVEFNNNEVLQGPDRKAISVHVGPAPDLLYIALCNPENIRRVLDALDECREALKKYSDPFKWSEFISNGDIFDEKDGDPLMAFNGDDDRPWQDASAVLAKHFGEGK